SGISILQVKDQLRGISCDRAVGLGPNKVLSVPDAIGQAIERYVQEKEGVQEDLPLAVSATTQGATQFEASISPSYGGETFDIGTCPDCGAGQLTYEEGCKKCHICGYSECG
ncbi:MAG TPA: response regulator SirA, partial [Gemmatimonadetes bacterium]|nr:response regulator SirA [Gemmatimonadota bacterium]